MSIDIRPGKVPARSAIRTEIRKFNAPLIYGEDGNLTIGVREGEADWVGPPNPVRDALWSDLGLSMMEIFLLLDSSYSNSLLFRRGRAA
jgi:hypothetical protein